MSYFLKFREKGIKMYAQTKKIIKICYKIDDMMYKIGEKFL